MNMTKVFFLLTIMPDNPGPPPPNKAIAILCASPDAPTNPRRCVCQLIRQSVLFITSARRKAVWFLSTPRPTQQSDHLTNHVPQRASPSVKDIWGMSQTDKDPGVPLEVKPHPLPVKRTSSPSTMSHPAFAPAYINAPPQQYPQYVSSPTYVATTYPTSSEHWQRPTQQYANMPTGQYYTTPLQMGSPETVNGAYVPQYGQWMPPSPIDGQGNPIEPLSPSIYHPSDPSMPHRVRAGEPGPTRTSRTTRRRSTQDVVSTVPQLDGESAELPESSSLAAGKRSKTSAAASSSTDTKSFACDLCTATFTRKGDCQRHRRSVHTHETPYDCQGCGENFSRSDVRGKHWKASPECESLHWKEVCRAMGRSSLVEQDK